MDHFKIILYVCNWGPHTAFQKLQNEGNEIPPEIKMVRIPCTGRINKSLLFKPFEMGADGVALIGCSPGTCRYGSGTEAAKSNTEDTRQILERIGIKKDRLQLVTYLPDESEKLLDYMTQFCNEIRSMGKSPVARKIPSIESSGKSIEEIISLYDVYSCQDCGKCTSACPLALSGKQFSPRAIANSVIGGDTNSETMKDAVWSCLTCGLCYDRCPSAVNFPEFIRDLRGHLRKNELNGNEVHGGFFQSLMRTMTAENLEMKRWNTLLPGIKTDPESKTLYFGGCNIYFDTFFNRHLGMKTFDIAIDSLRLLNFFDVAPSLLPNERCCGHDLLWAGDVDNFKKLAKLNTDMINGLDIEEVITSCPECYRSLSHDYEKHGFKIPARITHIYDFLEREIGKGAVDFKKSSQKFTFQDSCRMSRFEDKANLPRQLLEKMKPDNFIEMQDSGKSSICCGNSCWIGCDSFSKALQVKRIKQAKATGSERLLTSCPKCQVHLKCAMEDPFLGNSLKLEVMDLVSLVAQKICWE